MVCAVAAGAYGVLRVTWCGMPALPWPECQAMLCCAMVNMLGLPPCCLWGVMLGYLGDLWVTAVHSATHVSCKGSREQG